MCGVPNEQGGYSWHGKICMLCRVQRKMGRRGGGEEKDGGERRGEKKRTRSEDVVTAADHNTSRSWRRG